MVRAEEGKWALNPSNRKQPSILFFETTLSFKQYLSMFIFYIIFSTSYPVNHYSGDLPGIILLSLVLTMWLFWKKIILNGWGLSTTYRLPWVIKCVKLVFAKSFSPLNLYIKISLFRLIIDLLISTELNSLRLRSSDELWLNKRSHGRWKVDNAFKYWQDLWVNILPKTYMVHRARRPKTRHKFQWLWHDLYIL